MPSHAARTNHYLRKNHGTYVPHSWIFVDALPEYAPYNGAQESLIGRLAIGCAHACRYMDGRMQRWEKILFKSDVDFWGWLFKRAYNSHAVWLCGHGIAKTFTLLNGWQLIESGLFRLSSRKPRKREARDGESFEAAIQDGFFVDSQATTIMLLHADKVSIHLVDVNNYGKAELPEIAAAAGVTLPTRPSDKARSSAWEKYLSARVCAVRDYTFGLIDWWKRGDYGNWRHTIGSLAMAAFRHRFNLSKLLVHTCAQALELEREALAGGEFRCFRVGEFFASITAQRRREAARQRERKFIHAGRVHVYDVNSLYPAVMLDNKFPAELVAWKHEASRADIDEWRKTLCLIARVKVNSPERTFPYAEDGIRYWATGRFWTTLAGPELLSAYDDGLIEEIGMLSAYYPARPFGRFVEHFHGERLRRLAKGDKLGERFCKLMLNSLAGKFGQLSTEWEFIDYPNPPARYGTFPVVQSDGKTIVECRAIAGYVQQRQKRREGMESMPAIEAFVNSYGREFMRKVRETIGAQHIIYQASDSLHIDDLGREFIKPFLETEPNQLGKFRHVKTVDKAHYRGPHDYTHDGVHVVSGMKEDREDTGSDYYAQWEEPGLRSIISHQPNGTVVVKKIRKLFGGYHPKGILDSDGCVLPPRVENGELIISGAARFDEFGQPKHRRRQGARR